MPVDRHKLRFGRYRTQRFRYNAKVECLARGEVTIIRLSDGPIPRPVGRTQRAMSLVLYRDLDRAVRREAACAVMYWWSVCPASVRKWRRKLGVRAMNDGDRRLKREHATTEWASAFTVHASILTGGGLGLPRLAAAIFSRRPGSRAFDHAFRRAAALCSGR